ncbi:MAG TPA: IclR family transcriptional regulator [Candidatus Dormibacteraeota bacterium]|nr:IclR family transcriptional regulator [Candidatus Dormibacteraeota bacterium]
MAVGVISKVFRILEVIEASPSGLGLKSICDATRLNKSTAHRFLKHLEAEGYLIRADGGKYLIGPKLSQMGARADHRATLQAVSRPILSELWKSTRETVNLATMDQGQVLYIEVLESPHEFRLSSRVGSRRSVHATALGKALAAFLGDTRCEQILEGLNFQALTPKTIMNLVQFRQELEKVRHQGFAVDDEETTLGARCVSAPILGADGEAIGAISVSGPVTRVGREQVGALAGAVIQAAKAISSAMGFSQEQATLETPRKLHSVGP